MKMRTTLASITLILLFLACQGTKESKPTEIHISNLSDVDLTDKAIRVPKSDLKTLPERTNFPLLTSPEGDTIPSQTNDLDGDGSWDELFFVADLSAGGSTHFLLSWSDSEIDYTKRTSVRFGKRDSQDSPVRPKTSDTIQADEIHAKLGYQPYQTDGPSWENDKVGFRHYFDGRNSKDLFGKKLPGISPETVGISSEGAVEDNYHVMEDWGRDVLAVGNSAGIGGIEMMVGEDLVRIGCLAGDTVTNVESAAFEILNEGPVFSDFSITYFNWQPVDRNYEVKEQVRIWPGMYAFENNISVSGLQGDETLLVGLVNSNTPKQLSELEINEKFVALYTHDQQTYDREWWLGLGLLLPKDVYEGHGRAPEEGVFATSYFGKLNVSESKPVTYYAIGCWELSDPGFTDSTYFVNYLKDLADQLAVDVQVEII